MLSVELLIEYQPWQQLERLQPLVEQATQAAVASAVADSDETGPFQVNINLSNDEAVQALNSQFRGKDKPTNVLSFPFEDEIHQQIERPELLGDIILAYETVMLEAREQQKSQAHHLQHLVVHGVLHLFGYDHIEADEADEMEALEVEILQGLGIPSPYDDTEIDDTV